MVMKYLHGCEFSDGLFGGYLNLVLSDGGDGAAFFAVLAVVCAWYDMIATHVAFYVFKVCAGDVLILVAVILEIEEAGIATLPTENELEVVIRYFLFGDSARHNCTLTLVEAYVCVINFFFKIENILYDGLQVVHFILHLTFLYLPIYRVGFGNHLLQGRLIFNYLLV